MFAPGSTRAMELVFSRVGVMRVTGRTSNVLPIVPALSMEPGVCLEKMSGRGDDEGGGEASAKLAWQ